MPNACPKVSNTIQCYANAPCDGAPDCADCADCTFIQSQSYSHSQKVPRRLAPRRVPFILVTNTSTRGGPHWGAHRGRWATKVVVWPISFRSRSRSANHFRPERTGERTGERTQGRTMMSRATKGGVARQLNRTRRGGTRRDTRRPRQ